MASRAVSEGNVAQRTQCLNQKEAGRCPCTAKDWKAEKQIVMELQSARDLLQALWHLVLPHLSARGQAPAEPLGRMGIAAQSSPAAPESPSETPLPPAGPGPASSGKH